MLWGWPLQIGSIFCVVPFQYQEIIVASICNFIVDISIALRYYNLAARWNTSLINQKGEATWQRTITRYTSKMGR